MLNRSTSNPSTRRIRRRSSNERTYKLDLDANHIESLIRWLCEESSDDFLAKAYRQRYQGLGERQQPHNQNNTWTQEDLCDVISAIQALLSSVTNPPSSMVAEAHSTIGIIHQRLNQDARATQSFMQALWVQASSDDVSPITIGMTKTRLALAYGRKGESQKAISLLEKAIQDFREGGLSEEHELVTRAKEALHAFHLAETARRNRSNSRRISQGAA
ncbi:expressed unknown protein [Seminavis robusta]|uniref:Tetratricopeptide repeat protein n=1 Tax=Seminavis robusta TaxID=568900 RepID=A0A9N8EJJ3_9STRA|nr:expressed unknown protein [Seminavis robusta]|eukprot:Sro1284_g259200.1 n/a (217) ;mRNA; f:12959-13609